jgi:UDP-glucose 4-epimerase
MNVLVTGGLGYIGSHSVIELIGAGYNPVILDSLVNSKVGCLARLKKISGRDISFYQVDVRDHVKLKEILEKEKIEAVIHFAALKAVGESVSDPLSYYANNVYGSIALFECLKEVGVQKLVFSSSATVYGEPSRVPIDETFPTKPTNPYGRTKLMVEEIGQDICHSDKNWAVINLRYFNPIGAHSSGWIGEDPSGIPNNLLPYISQVAIGKYSEVKIFGNDWPTADGTGVRDYIHVVDLAKGHVAALTYLKKNTGTLNVNLGTGRGYSVLELIDTFKRASGREIPYRYVARRDGDIAVCYADASLAWSKLSWRAELDLDRMCIDAWNWQVNNPRGFE